MNPPNNRDTLAPGPGDDLTITERVIRLENLVLELKGAVNDSLGNIHHKLDGFMDEVRAMAANLTNAMRAVRSHSERIHKLELANMNGEVEK